MLIDEKMKGELKEIFSSLTRDVKFVFFTQELECQFCRETKSLLTELNEMSDKFSLEIFNFVTDKEKADKYGVDKIPATVLLDEDSKDYGIRFYGIPSGYEFSSLIEVVKMLGTGKTGLKDEIVDEVKRIDKPVQMQVFVTPTCPYCPQAVLTAHKFAYLNQNVTSSMIEVTEFPYLVQKYNVKGVPRTVINEDNFIEGAVPEENFLNKINESFGKE